MRGEAPAHCCGARNDKGKAAGRLVPVRFLESLARWAIATL